jgi:thiol-disulfide isomerase/thioredoxin
MNCKEAEEKIFWAEQYRLFDRVLLAFHTLRCPHCRKEARLYDQSMELMREDFFSEAAWQGGFALADNVMRIIEENEVEMDFEEAVSPISIARWIITGIVIILSFAVVFFGRDFDKIADSQGTAFLLPVGITIGVVVTSYCGLFIASHLKELSSKFGLR